VNDQQQEQFEKELRWIWPAPPPPDFMARLSEARPVTPIRRRIEVAKPGLLEIWLRRLRWLAPATAATVLAVGLAWHWYVRANRAPKPDLAQETAAPPALKADAVQIGHELVSTFDAVAKLPNGEPIRFGFVAGSGWMTWCSGIARKEW